MPEPPTPALIEARRERAESARLDNFVDGAFAFAITLLVISGASLPRNVAALEHALLGVPAFAACFAELALFWHGHVRWRDTVRLTDGTSLRLSLLLVFFALIFVFPLHLVFSSGFNGISGGVLSPGFTINTTSALKALFACFGLSFACMAGTMAALYAHGVHAGTALDRTAAVTLRASVVAWAFVAAVGLLSVVVAILVSPRVVGIAGILYFLTAFTSPIAHLYSKHLKATLPP